MIIKTMSKIKDCTKVEAKLRARMFGLKPQLVNKSIRQTKGTNIVCNNTVRAVPSVFTPCETMGAESPYTLSREGYTYRMYSRAVRRSAWYPLAPGRYRKRLLRLSPM